MPMYQVRAKSPEGAKIFLHASMPAEALEIATRLISSECRIEGIVNLASGVPLRSPRTDLPATVVD